MAKRPAMDQASIDPIKPLYKKKIKRTETDTKEIWADTFKLLVAPYMKRDGLANHPDEDPGSFIEAEHVHFYRTFDSDGKQLDRSSGMCNHFHSVVTAPNPEDPDGPPMIVSVSGPMRLGKKRVQGRWVLQPVELNNYDHHTHDVEYLKSGKVKARVTNIEAQKVIAYDAQKGASVAGVVES